ncbi:UvrD-helicase domain-containing protein [Methanosarcina mazei]|uniref:DNA 3'-5' helicase n=1 Tax=Methanosarcina mazei SarPi TaxID=1434115 RepID=A0A0E3R7N6_METMZ|nr:ATP-dependent helicase [Methanosarcina mazei]AKB61178.1 ATP-dependent DNA helicase pcrA [Methanosarcina mazei SarPi]
MDSIYKVIKLRVTPIDWKPSDGLTLEDKALETVKSSTNFYVIAGPGAGKTELLAQRACFLLQTDTCREPRKILAISFKKDAARNIEERVKRRCGDELARRFISKTYDSFAKSLLDHFRKALPNDYKLSPNYEIISDEKIIDRYFGLIRSLDNLNVSREQMNNLKKYLAINKLPLNSGSSGDINELIYDIWMYSLQGEDNQSEITFPMVSRLSEFLIRSNPKIRSSIVATYSHIFLDEFQDTTNNQYDLIKTCFYNTENILTAVGDNKQRIMTWAGADVEVFNKFKIDFKAKKCELLMNYRSAPRLVEIQKILIKKLSDNEGNVSTNEKWNKNDGICEVWNFNNHLEEAKILASEITQLINSEKLNPNDICIIAKQQLDQYCTCVIEELNELGIRARNETMFQDLISEEFVHLVLDIIKCSISEKSRDEWANSREMTRYIHGISVEDDLNFTKLRMFDKNFKFALKEIKKKFSGVKSKEDLKTALDEVINYLGKEKLIDFFPQYSQHNYFEQIYNKLHEYLWNEYSSCGDWVYAIESLKGLRSIPIMTIHKSKGLEYDTVVFIGLEDDAFWTFKKQTEEDMCAFFVALSRAKKRVIFTFSETRINNGCTRKQRRKNINSLYQMLEQSGVVDVRNF